MTLNAIFLLIAVGWRSLAQYRRTGDFGFRRPSRAAGSFERAAGVLLVIGVTGLLVAPACAIVDLVPPLRPLDHPAVQVLGLLLSCSGIGLTVLAQFQMGDSWRVGVDPSEATSLVEHGLFGYVRNPIYSGMLLYALGLFCLLPSLGSATAGLIFVFGVQLQVRRVEEPHLARKHGRAYREYAHATGRFIPWVGRL